MANLVLSPEYKGFPGLEIRESCHHCDSCVVVNADDPAKSHQPNQPNQPHQPNQPNQPNQPRPNPKHGPAKRVRPGAQTPGLTTAIQLSATVRSLDSVLFALTLAASGVQAHNCTTSNHRDGQQAHGQRLRTGPRQ